MNSKYIVPVIVALFSGIAVFLYLRVFGDQSLAAKLGVVFVAGMGAAFGLMIGHGIQKKT